MALAINGLYRHQDITRTDLVEEFASWGLRRTEPLIQAVLDQLHAVVSEERPLEGAFPRLQEQLLGFVDNLRRGQAVGGR